MSAPRTWRAMVAEPPSPRATQGRMRCSNHCQGEVDHCHEAERGQEVGVDGEPDHEQEGQPEVGDGHAQAGAHRDQAVAAPSRCARRR